MALYKVRKGYTVLHKGQYHKGGAVLDMTDEESKAIPQLLEPAPVLEPEVVSDPVEGSEVVTEDVVMSATKNRAITAPRGRRKLS